MDRVSNAVARLRISRRKIESLDGPSLLTQLLFKSSSKQPVFRRKIESLDVFVENAPPHVLMPNTGTAYYSELSDLVQVTDIVRKGLRRICVITCLPT